jgi:hypothetical protein
MDRFLALNKRDDRYETRLKKTKDYLSVVITVSGKGGQLCQQDPFVSSFLRPREACELQISNLIVYSM